MTPCSSNTGSGATYVSAALTAMRSTTASTTTCAATPPNRLAVTSCVLPIRAALMVVAISGSDVATPSMTMPSSAWPSPVRAPTSSAQYASRVPAIQTTAAAPAKIARFVQMESDEKSGTAEGLQ